MTPRNHTTPKDETLRQLCSQLAILSEPLEETGAWPEKQLKACAEAGVFKWFIPVEYGGLGSSATEISRGYLSLSGACLTTTFVLTQLTGACRRIAAASNEGVPVRLMQELLTGNSFATLGISHLTTSRRHLKRPVLTAEKTKDGFVLNGFSPWVTGGGEADHIVTGAELDDGRQLLAVVPTSSQGVEPQIPARLVALNGSRTAAVRFHQVQIDRDALLSEPMHDVMKQATGGNTGGLQTSTLALGLAGRAVDFIREQAEQRSDLIHAAEQLAAEVDRLVIRLLELTQQKTPLSPVSASDLRADSNSVVLRATQAALVAAKGAGYIASHPAGRWCKEALFFLVWSCPQPVLDANLCELAGLRDESFGNLEDG